MYISLEWSSEEDRTVTANVTVQRPSPSAACGVHDLQASELQLGYIYQSILSRALQHDRSIDQTFQMSSLITLNVPVKIPPQH